MPSRHAKPFCWAKNKFSQDDISKVVDNQIRYMEKGRGYVQLGIECPGCKLHITNEDVTDTVELQRLVSIFRARGSRLHAGLWG